MLGALLITITGSTGTIGSELVRLLSAAGANTRAIYRNGAKMRPLPNVTWLQADLDDPGQLEVALAGTTRLFLLTGNEPDDTYLEPTGSPDPLFQMNAPTADLSEPELRPDQSRMIVGPCEGRIYTRLEAM